ncbi:gephyrin-like molybdotransferase Glp [Clostridium niameyense]|uniref:molybdopterin molybdotransferase MoeA n=1 Tax=Clostridium niameyense TaxID=1622073 RepID=UPI00067E9DC9|nr:gephyrin-like molybdotransferase Glp [Clostridium niameyense]
MIQGIELEKAQEMLKEKVFNLDIEEVELFKCHERILAEDIYSPINQPPFNRSPLDGYAFRGEDSKGANSKNPITLKIIDKVYAGHYTDKEVVCGTAVRIMTGAPIPKGANCVVKQEVVECKDGKVKIFNEFTPGQNVCPKGEDVKQGQLILKKDTILKYGEIGVLSSVGITKVKVYKKLKLGVLSTGDEVLDIGEDLTYGKIYNSNLYCIAARIKECYCTPFILGSVEDDLKSMCDKIEKSLQVCDLIITTGGVSVGEKDIVSDAIKKLGGEILFWRVNIKPGSALLCSVLKGKLIISLSGNPGAAITSFELMVRPLLSKIIGIKEIDINRIKGILVEDFPKKSSIRRFIRANIMYKQEKNIIKLTQVAQGNGILSSILNSNCLIDVPKGSDELKSGQLVEVILL